MSIGGGASSGQSNTSTQLDPQIKGDWQQLYNMTQGVAANQVPQNTVVDWTPDEALAQSQIRGNYNAGQGTVGQAASSVAGMTGYQPPSIGTTYQGKPIMAGVDHYSAHNVNAPTQANLSQFENPYTSDVIDTSLSQLDQARRQALNANSATATQQGGEGAWDGSRAGVSDALTNEGYGRQEASMIAGLNDQNFQTALQGSQTDALTNAAAQNQKEQFNAAANNQASQFNANQALTAEEANAGYNLAGAQTRLQAGQTLGALGGQQQNMALAGDSALFGLGQAEQQHSQQTADVATQNALQKELLPIQTVESAFGILPSTNSGSNQVSHSSGKSGQAGIG